VEWRHRNGHDLPRLPLHGRSGYTVFARFACRVGHNPQETALRIIRRSITLFLLGLAINGFPDYVWNTLRLPGILQRIAVCYALCGFLYLSVRERRQRDRTIVFASISIVLLASYWAMLKLIEVPGIGRGHLDPYGALPAVVDRAVFGANHLWQWGIRTNGNITYDPEGLLSTIPALVPTLVGMLVGGVDPAFPHCILGRRSDPRV
jgi:predicted acyltransferase